MALHIKYITFTEDIKLGETVEYFRGIMLLDLKLKIILKNNCFGCGVTHTGDIQELFGCNPVQCALE